MREAGMDVHARGFGEAVKLHFEVGAFPALLPPRSAHVASPQSPARGRKDAFELTACGFAQVWPSAQRHSSLTCKPRAMVDRHSLDI
jgi:hypothetical protein